ncbi:MAG: ERF family protein [Rhizobiales bacterium]|nr:ERF family protein [Hyphomicrobiales bacterium]
MDSTEACELEGVPDAQESPTSDQDGWDKSANLFTRLVKAQAEAKKLEKTKPKSDGMKYEYVTHDDIASEAKKILTKNGILFFPSVAKYEQEGNKTVINVKASFYNADKPEEKLETEGLGFGVDNQDKGPGKAYSYACKYILAKTLMLNTSDDIEEHDIDFNPAATSEAALKTRIKTENEIKEWVNSFSGLIDESHTYDQLKKIKTDNAEMFKAKVVPEKTKEALAKKLHDKMELAREAIVKEVSEDA